jgi:CRISPR/Cas system CSM-associated protein Csm3 (group 7 of RAMP superfamily)
MEIKYKIQFHTDWHCGSGLAAGADVDALVVKDKDGLPYIPGKTMKGLIREAVENIRNFSKNGEIKDFVEAFGYFDDKSKKEKGFLFFTNAELDVKERYAIVSNKVVRFMYRTIASTAIDENGVAEEHSLRKMEVVVPCDLYGEILGVPENMVEEIKKSLSYIKRLGQNRNRGLGRCTISVESVDKEGGEK